MKKRVEAQAEALRPVQTYSIPGRSLPARFLVIGPWRCPECPSLSSELTHEAGAFQPQAAGPARNVGLPLLKGVPCTSQFPQSTHRGGSFEGYHQVELRLHRRGPGVEGFCPELCLRLLM